LDRLTLLVPSAVEIYMLGPAAKARKSLPFVRFSSIVSVMPGLAKVTSC